MAEAKTHWISDLMSSPVPGVASDAGEEIRRMVNRNPLIQECAAGNPRAMVAMYIGNWPYINGFPPAIYDLLKRRVVRDDLNKTFGGATKEVVGQLARVFRGVAQEERAHSREWVFSASAVGITREQLHADPLPEVEALLVQAFDSNPLPAILALVATELIATHSSVRLLESNRFLEAHNHPRALRWYLEHVLPHDGPDHQALQLYFASRVFRGHAEEMGQPLPLVVWNTEVGFAESYNRASNVILEKLA